MALLGLLGFHTGGFMMGKSRQTAATKNMKGLLGRRQLFRWATLFALTLQLSGILAYGLKNWFFGTYGWASFEYGVAYYLLLASQLVAYPAYLAYLYFCLTMRRYELWIFLFPLIFGGLFLWNGGRGQMLYFLFSAAIVAYYTGKRFKARSVGVLGIVVVAIFMISVFSRHRAIDISLLPSKLEDFIGGLIGELSWGGSVTTSVMELDAAGSIPRQYGLTYIGAIPNLLPGFFFGTNWDRPILPPSLIFHLAYAPWAEDVGFGFSILAEVYMNWGQWGAFPVMFALGLLLSLAYRRLSTGSYFAIVMYAVILYQFLWYLRSDSLAILKSVLYSLLVLIVVELSYRFMAVLSTNTASVKQHSTEWTK